MSPSPFRYLLFGLNYAALVLFYFIEKKEFEKYDIGISYTLLVGLDLISIVMLLLSDWVVVALARAKYPIWFVSILGKLPCIDRVRLETSIRFFHLTDMLDGMKYVKTLDFTNDLRDHIFEELKMKSELADDLETAKEISSSRGDWILRYENCSDFLRWINDVDFDQSLILWHIATELCYYTDEELKANANDSGNQTNAGNSDNKDIKHNRVVSKRLSDYLLYLLLVQSTMLSSIAGIGRVRFRDTCAEAKKFFRGRKILKEGKNFGKCFGCCFNKCRSKGEEVQHQLLVQACKSILAVNTVAEPVTVKGDRSKSVLFDACILAKELKKLGRQRMWQIVSKVWVELLSYAACHCRGETHVAQLSKGGQLLTLVSLLMTHLGLGDQFQINKGRARAKLIVWK